MPANEAVSDVEVRRRRWALALCFAVAVLEGVDLQSMGVAAPGVASTYKLAPDVMGLIGSASSLGLFFGAISGGMASDRWGRRAVLMTAVALFGLCSLVTPWADDTGELLFIRFLTGLGLGGGLPMIIAVAAEAVSPARRSGAVTMMYCATPIGGMVVSAVAYAVASEWRVIFYVGGSLPLLLLPLLFLRLRDAPRSAGSVGATERTNVWEALFGERRASVTPLLWVAFFGSVLVLYLLLNWLPLLLIGKGFSRSEASIAQIWLNLGGATGAILLGNLVSRVNVRSMLALIFVAEALALFALALGKGSYFGAIVSSFAAGLLSQGAVFVLYGIAAVLYYTKIRGTGVGWAVAFGRLGSVAGPVLAGMLLASGRSSEQVLIGILPIVLVTAVAVHSMLHRPPPGSAAVDLVGGK